MSHLFLIPYAYKKDIICNEFIKKTLTSVTGDQKSVFCLSKFNATWTTPLSTILLLLLSPKVWSEGIAHAYCTYSNSPAESGLALRGCCLITPATEGAVTLEVYPVTQTKKNLLRLLQNIHIDFIKRGRFFVHAIFKIVYT